MKLKSKYNIGNIVRFYNNAICDDDIGKIEGIKMSFSWANLQKTSYDITPIRVNNHYSVEVEEFRIKQTLNKIAFEKAYAELCAKEMMKSE